MKNNIIVLFIWLLILLGAISCLMSCHSAKHHFDKFIEKGGQVECPNIIADSIRDINIIMPAPKWQIRLENKRFNDSLSAVLLYGKMNYKKYKDSLDNAYKMHAKSEQSNKTEIRQNARTDRADIKETGATNRTEIRQAEKTNRSLFNWWKWLLAGYFLFPMTRFLYRKARDGLIRFRW